MSNMVIADKYRLDEPLSVTKGTWKKDGKKTLIHRKAILKSYVDSRNEHDNRELYIVDEEATKEFQELRAENIKKKANKPKGDQPQLADAINKLADKMEGIQEAEIIEDKPKKKRTRRTKEQIEADKIKEEE